jgi:hypothetical protein
MRTRMLLAIAATIVLRTATFGQVPDTTAVGVVTDTSGAVIENATVVLLDVDRNQPYTTKSEPGTRC